MSVVVAESSSKADRVASGKRSSSSAQADNPILIDDDGDASSSPPINAKKKSPVLDDAEEEDTFDESDCEPIVKSSKYAESEEGIELLKMAVAASNPENKLWTPETFPKPSSGIVLVTWYSPAERDSTDYCTSLIRYALRADRISDSDWDMLTAVHDYQLNYDDLFYDHKFEAVEYNDSKKAAQRLRRAFWLAEESHNCVYRAPLILRFLLKNGVSLPVNSRVNCSAVTAIINIDDGDAFKEMGHELAFGCDFDDLDEKEQDEEKDEDDS